MSCQYLPNNCKPILAYNNRRAASAPEVGRPAGNAVGKRQHAMGGEVEADVPGAADEVDAGEGRREAPLEEGDDFIGRGVRPGEGEFFTVAPAG